MEQNRGPRKKPTQIDQLIFDKAVKSNSMEKTLLLEQLDAQRQQKQKELESKS